MIGFDLLRTIRTDRRIGPEPTGGRSSLRHVDIVGWLFEQVPFLAVLLDSELLLSLLFLTLTAVVMASGTPGMLVPISFSSGALLGGWLGILAVVLGATLGSHAFFVVSRKWLAGRLRRRWEGRLEGFDRNIEKRGFVYLLGLRLVGVPHLPVTAACALSAIRARSFLVATLLGFLPAVAIAATAGAAV